MRSQEDFKARLAEGHALAPSLVGLDRDAAIERARGLGFDPQPIPATAEAITLDSNANRIRLFLDEDEVVIRAWGG